MTPNRQPPFRTDLLITLAGLIGAVIFFLVYDQAFPSAALDLKLSRQQAETQATQALKTLGYDTSGYTSALTFRSDDLASVYLQQTLGIPETNRRLQPENLPVWYWYVRWYKPLQQEEYSVQLSPQGRVDGFSHSIQEDAPGAALEQSAARRIAQAYLVQNQGWDPAAWEEISASSQTRTGGRVDHRFEWKRRDFQAGEAELHTTVRVQGDQVGSYDYWIKVPEAFGRHFSEQQNSADFIASICMLIVWLGFSIIGGIVLILSLFRHGLPRSSGYRVAALVGLVSLLAALNYLPLYKLSYGTTQSYAQFWLQIVFTIFVDSAATAGFIFMIWSGGEKLGKLAWPRQERLLLFRWNNDLSRRPASLRYIPPERWMALSRSAWRGLMMSGLLGGYTVLFYLVAIRLFGGWTPLDVSYTNLYATPLPFLGPLESGLVPAVTEEVLVRLIGGALIFGLTRRKWLAITIPGVLWAFAHLSYVRDPYYLRGIELSIPAVLIFGLFFLKFDLTTTIIGHLTYNAMLGALPMLRSGESYFVFCGLVVVFALLSPLLPGLWATWRERRSAPRHSTAPDPVLSTAGPGDRAALQALGAPGVDWAALLDDPQAVLLCLNSGDEFVGAAAGRLENGQAMLEAVWVQHGWRERYWGTRLAEAVVAALHERGAETVRVSVRVREKLALAFMAGMGWRPQAQVLDQGPAPTFGSWLQDMGLRRKRA